MLDEIHSKTQLYILSFIALILLIPLITMQYTEEVNWGWMDFIVASILLYLVLNGIAFILSKVKSPTKKLIFIILILLVFLLVWAELAVGILAF